MQKIVFFGDSITEGVIGASYINILRRELGDHVQIVNAGINGDTVMNLLRRFKQDVVAHDPDLIVIMIGLNDIGTAYGEPWGRHYYRLAKGVPVEVTPRRFAIAYRQLIAAFRQHTSARIALSTLTPLGEQLDHGAQQYIHAYSTIIRALALQEELELIDVWATFQQALAIDPRPSPPYRIWQVPLDLLTIRLTDESYASLAVQRGYRFLCDGVHLAPPGAQLVAQTMLEFLQRKNHAD